MTRRLILMRHAKSDWDDPTLPDKDRILSNRGQRSAKALGDWLRDNDYLPDLALVSSAQRTRETWELLGIDCPVVFVDALYHAAENRIETVLANRGDQAETVLIIGHNPGIGYFANLLHRGTDNYDFARYPTCATAVFECNIEYWSEFHSSRAKLVDFVIPRQLTD